LKTVNHSNYFAGDIHHNHTNHDLYQVGSFCDMVPKLNTM